MTKPEKEKDFWEGGQNMTEKRKKKQQKPREIMYLSEANYSLL